MTKFSTTEKESFLDCGWRWDFNSLNRMGLEPVTPLKALWLGTLVHKSLDLLATTLLIKEPHQFTPVDKDTPLDLVNGTCYHINPNGALCDLPPLAHLRGIAIYDVFADAQLDKMVKNYTEQIGAPPSSMELKETLDTINLGRAMMTNYMNYYGTPIPDEFEYISTEQKLVVDIPGTEHCACRVAGKCTCDQWYCLPLNQEYTYYTFCTCIESRPTCKCRQNHQLATTLDGLIRRKLDGWIFILENKTFTYHPSVQMVDGRKTYPDLERAHQFMNYTWAGNQLGLDIKGVFYNGLWKRAAPTGKWRMDDLFVRTSLPYTRQQLLTTQEHTRITTLKMGDPMLQVERNVHAVGGCNGVNQCHYKRLCDARFSGVNYEYLLAHNFVKREEGSVLMDEEDAE